MTNLNKFDKILDDMEFQAKALSKTAKAYKRLDDLVQDYAQINSLFKQNNQKLDDNAELVIRKHFAIKESLKDLKAIHENLRAENRKFYLDFENIVRIKLDEHKSEIKHFIEQERTQIKEIIEESNKKNRVLILTEQKKLMTTNIVFGIIITLLLIGILAKLFLG